jgi:hypothetical protein
MVCQERGIEMTETLIHPFEKAGLGKAPFRFVGMEEKVITHPDGTTQAGGSCQYCSTGIRYLFNIKSADGHTFHVGSDCVAKTHAKGSPLLTAVELATKKAKKVIAAQKLTARIAQTRATLDANPSLLTDRPHPNSWRASCGDTGRDYIEFLLRCGGAKGRGDACKIVEKAA